MIAHPITMAPPTASESHCLYLGEVPLTDEGLLRVIYLLEHQCPHHSTNQR